MQETLRGAHSTDPSTVQSIPPIHLCLSTLRRRFVCAQESFDEGVELTRGRGMNTLQTWLSRPVYKPTA